MPGGVDIQEIHGQIEIKNFQETCTVTTLDGGHATFNNGYCVQLVVDSLLGTDGTDFGMKIVWEAIEGDRGIFEFVPVRRAKMGVRLFFNGCGTCFLKLRVEIMNKDPSNNRVAEAADIRMLRSGEHNGWGPSPGHDGPEIIHNNGLLTLEDVFDPSKGWLENGTLRANILLKIFTKDQNQISSVAPVGSSPQASLSKDFGALLSEGERADVIIKVNGEDIRAHSLILMARSSVFRSMLSSPMREATEGTVIIKDLDVAAVKATIAFMYTGQIDEYLLKPDADTLGILEAAHRYDVSSLVDLCVQSLIARLDVSTVSEWLHVADLIGNAGLKTSCLNFMRLHITEVQATDKFAKFVATRPALVTELLASLFPPAKRRRTE